MTKKTKKKRGPGRPKVAGKMRRKRVLSVRVTDDVMAAIEARCDWSGETPSSWAADVLGQACGLNEGPHNLGRPLQLGEASSDSPNYLAEEGEQAIAREFDRDA